MSIRNNNTTGYIANQKDSINRLIHETRELKRAIAAMNVNITTTITGSGFAQETTLQSVDTNTADIDQSVTDLEATTVVYGDKANWDRIAGNSIEYTWIDGSTIVDGSPNRIVSVIVYKTGVATIFTQTFAYNANDEVTSITTT